MITVPSFQELEIRAAKLQNLLKQDASSDVIVRAWSDLEAMAYEVQDEPHRQMNLNVYDQAWKEEHALMENRIAGLLIPLRKQIIQQLQTQNLVLPPSIQRYITLYSTEFEIDELKQQANLITSRRRSYAAEAVQLNGEEVKMADLGRLVYNSDRQSREKGVRAWSEWQKEAALLNTDPLLELLDLRKKMAQQHSSGSFLQVAWNLLPRTSYSPDDIFTVMDHLTDVIKSKRDEINRVKSLYLGYEVTSWDYYDPRYQALYPVVDKKGLEVAREFYQKVLPELNDMVNELDAKELLLLDNDQNKSERPYVKWLPLQKLAYMVARDNVDFSLSRVMVHELAHVYHYLSYDQDATYFDYWCDIEMFELFTHFMELLFVDHVCERYPREGVPVELMRLAIIDEILMECAYNMGITRIEHELHTHQGSLEHADILEISRRNAERSGLLYSEVASYGESLLSQDSIFMYPFSRLSYVIAWMGAFQMYNEYKKNPEILQDIKTLLKRGANITIFEFLEQCNVSFQLNTKHIDEAFTFISAICNNAVTKFASPQKEESQ